MKSEESINEVKLIDSIYAKYGFGFITFQMFFVTFNYHIFEGMQLNLYIAMIIPINEHYKLSKFEQKSISALFFLSIALASLNLGYLTRKFGRIKLFHIFSFLGIIAQFIMAFTTNSKIFLILRFIIGYSTGISTPICMNVLTEYSPIKNRSTILLLAIFGFTVGYIFLLFIMFLIMPNYESDKSKEVLIIILIPCVLFSIANFFCFKDSPRNLILLGKENEAFSILDKFNGETINDHDRSIIINEVKSGMNSLVKPSYTDVFSPSLLKLTIILIFISLFRLMIYFGIMTVSSLTLEKLEMIGKKKNNHEVLLNEIFIAIIILPSYLIAGPISEIKKIGRKNTIIISYIIAFINLILAIVHPKLFSLFIGIGVFFMDIGSGMCSCYTTEIFPTQLRDIAFGIFYFFVRIGCFLSQFVYLWMNDINIWLPYIFNITIIFIMCIIIYNLPYETSQKSLDNIIPSKEEGIFDEEKFALNQEDKI